MRTAIIACTLVFLVFLSLYIWKMEHRPPILEVYFLSLKSGRSVFIRTPDDKRILIDGGSNGEIIRHITKILPFYSRRIDFVIATDTDSRNVSGLIDVVDRYHVSSAFVPAFNIYGLSLASSTDKAYAEFEKILKDKGVKTALLSAGDDLILGEDVFADVLFPENPDHFKYSKASPPNIVLKISYKSKNILLLNNATVKIQKFLIGQEVKSNLSNVDVLFISHSDSPDSISLDFIQKIKPKYLVYSENINRSNAKSKNKKTDPLFFLLNDHRFNLKEKGDVRIVLDREDINIKQ